MDKDDKNEMTAAGGGLPGPQLPLGDTDESRMSAVRELVRRRVREVVRRKGDSFVLYAPNPGKKGVPNAVQTFPTKAGAKKAELARFPPRDPNKLARLRKQIDKLNKGDKNKEEPIRKVKNRPGVAKTAKKAKHGTAPKIAEAMTEATIRRVDFMHRTMLAKCIKESLFREEKTGSEWDEYIKKLSDKSMSGDKKFQNLQKSIEKKTETVLQDSFNSIAKAVKKGKNVKLKSFGVKRSAEKGKTYLAFGATMDNVSVEPIYIHIEAGVPKLEISPQAKIALTKIEPDNAKMFRAELITVQERILDEMETLLDAVEARDRYLAKLEGDIDSYVAGLSPLHVSMLKQLLVKKYRKL